MLALQVMPVTFPLLWMTLISQLREAEALKDAKTSSERITS